MPRISFALNIILLAVLILVFQSRRHDSPDMAASPAQAVPRTSPPQPRMSGPAEKPFHWQQIESKTDYRAYIANLRAIGCPETTIEDIVRGDTSRAFAYERYQLNLDGSGTGPWSQYRQEQLVASLLGQASGRETAQNSPPQAGQTAPSETAAAAAPTPDAENAQNSAGAANPPPSGNAAPQAYPLFLQNVNWRALGFTADEQAAIAQVRQQYLDNAANLNPTGTGTGGQTSSSGNSGKENPAPYDPDAALRDALGADYAAYEQQQYFHWFQPQALAAGDGPLVINPDAFSMTK